MNITKIISKTFDSRLKQIDLYASQAMINAANNGTLK